MAHHPERREDDADPDGARWIVVDGRRRRATDPAIPERFRRELVDELMAARRAVGVAVRRADPDAESAARRRVHLAKVALGERGHPWWEPAGAEALAERLRAVVLTLVAHRAPDRTICPSDAARAIGGTGWRSLMDPVRDVARTLARDHLIVVSQKGEPLDPDSTWRGPIRLAAAPDNLGR